jgi:tetratricopeptide (TPR) repeat protein
MRSALLLFALAAATASAQTGPGALSPAEGRIQAAEAQIRQKPDRFQAYNDFALALARRARETGDASYFEKAEQALAQSFRIRPGNFEGQQARVLVLLGEDRYREALDLAQALNSRMRDDVLVWTYMAEAAGALGDYDKAEKWAQWAMDLRPGNVPAYLCGAALREDWGDIDGALDFLGKALQETPPLETEETAWILTAMARLSQLSGKPDAADGTLQQALKTFPGYHLTLDELVRTRMAQRRYAEAVECAETRNLKFATPESRYLEAEALEDAGQHDAARAAFEQFEREARSRIDRPDNANRELVLYYTDHNRQLGEALRIARLQLAGRHDVWTLDAGAWAMFAGGRTPEAQGLINKALAVGTRDAVLFYHAGAIAAASGDRAAAVRYLTQSLDLEPASEVAGRDHTALAKLARPDGNNRP